MRVCAAAQNVPGGRSGPAALAADANTGNCDLGDGDTSGYMSLKSRGIKIPSNSVTTLHLAFIHYMASELGWDGGNLKISINSAPYSIVPATAFIFNPYNATLQTAAAGNTDLLAGQPAFTGTVRGQVPGSLG